MGSRKQLQGGVLSWTRGHRLAGRLLASVLLEQGNHEVVKMFTADDLGCYSGRRELTRAFRMSKV